MAASCGSMKRMKRTVLLSFSGHETGDTSSGHSPATKDVAPPPPRRPAPPHQLSPPQVGHDCSSVPLICRLHHRVHPSVMLYLNILRQVAVRASAHTLSVEPLPLTLATLLLLLLSPWGHRWWRRDGPRDRRRQKTERRPRFVVKLSVWSFCKHRSTTVIVLVFRAARLVGRGVDSSQLQVHSMHFYVTCTDLYMCLFICI